MSQKVFKFGPAIVARVLRYVSFNLLTSSFIELSLVLLINMVSVFRYFLSTPQISRAF